jgi:hypothetical protein
MDCDVHVHARGIVPVRWRHLRLVIILVIVVCLARDGHLDWTAIEVLTR